MADLARTHQALAEDYRWHLHIAAGKLLAQPSWSLEATVALIHTQTQGITIGPVRSLPLWLDHLPPELDAFVRLQEQGASFEESYQRCLAEQGQEFVAAIEATKASGALVTHDNLAEFAALSQKGFARDPRELLVLAQWPDIVTAFLVSCQPLR
ncbi:MAG: hypothetical protein WAM11_03300 [Cyanobium sp.]